MIQLFKKFVLRKITGMNRKLFTNLTGAVAGLQAMISLWDFNTGMLIFANDYFQNFLGLQSLDNFDISAFAGFIHPDDFRMLADTMERDKFRTQGAAYNYRLRDSEGHMKTLSCHSLPWTDGTILNIGIELQQQASDFKKYDILLRQLARMAKIGLWELNRDMTSAWWSEEIRRIAGNYEGTSGRAFMKKIVHPDDWNMMSGSLRNTLKTGQISRIIYRIHRYDDHELRWIHCTSRRVKAPLTGEYYLIGMVLDVTEAVLEKSRFKEHVNALTMEIQKSETDFRALVDNLPIGIVVHDGNTFLYANNRAQFFLDASSADRLIGRPIEEAVHPDFIQTVRKRVNNMFQNNENTDIVHEKLLRMDGTVFDAEVGAMPVKWEGKNAILTYVNDLTEILKSKKELEEQKRLLNAVVENIPEHIFVKDAKDLRFVMVNKAAKDMLQKKQDELLGHTDQEIFLSETAEDCIAGDRKTIARRSVTEVEKVMNLTSGPRLMHIRKVPIFDENNRPQYVMSLGKDITEAREEEMKLRQFAAVTQNSTEGVVIADERLVITNINKAFTVMTGYEEDEILFQHVDLLLNRDDLAPGAYNAMEKAVLERGRWSGETWFRHKDGHTYPAWLNISMVTDKTGQNKSLVGIFSDVTRVRQTEHKEAYLAIHDPLTGLGNRMMLDFYISHGLNSARREKERLSVIFLDLDDFKSVNDIYGHNIGDQILVEVSKRMKERLRDTDIIVRFGGDEFVIILEKGGLAEGLATTADRLLNVINKPFWVDDTKYKIGASIGIATFPDDATDVDTLLKAADNAMYKAKETGKNRYAFYDSSLNDVLTERLKLRREMEKSIDAGHFMLYYQPQFEMKTGRIIGFEALARWNHPEMGMISPARFIPIAEQSRLIIPLGARLLKDALAQMAVWRSRTGFSGRMSVNVSGVQLEYGNFVDILNKTLDETGLDPAHVELEVTESVFRKDPERWLDILGRLKKIGVHLAIDDFGTGYSSLAYLRQYPFDKLKIDKVFVDDLPHDKGACAIANTVIALGKNLGISILAEGVETKEQADYLIENGCDDVQGYLYDRPLSPIDAEKRLTGM